MSTLPSLPLPPAPAGSNTVNSFIMTDDATGLIAFVGAVFDAVENPDARTADADGLVLHSEVHIGDSLLTIADRKPAWPYTPAFTRVYVVDAAATLERAVQRGARIVTEPTDFWGDVFSRFADPFGHLWWVYQHTPAEQEWDAASDTSDASGDIGEWNAADASAAGESWENFATPELDYIHSTLIDAMNSLRDPREKN
ncbi:VOC family protein [Microbacterium sp. LMI12-1-1.1]|uniref:VOC family protein n=1 Tax=unclassified Microbacterium TaxID=2609290 RepID=UPI00343A427A